MNPHEELLISNFILKEKRERWRTLLPSKRRGDLVASFAHKQDFDPKFATHLIQGEILERLRSVKGLRTSYLISENPDWDGRWKQLSELEEVLYGFLGTYISCVPGELAVYHGEDVGENYLLQRPIK